MDEPAEFFAGPGRHGASQGGEAVDDEVGVSSSEFGRGTVFDAVFTAVDRIIVDAVYGDEIGVQVPEERCFADACVITKVPCIVGEPVLGRAENRDLEAFAHAGSGFSHDNLLVVTVVAGDHDDGFKFEAVKF